jgi:transcriptional regulator with XRE-family HTH domain
MPSLNATQTGTELGVLIKAARIRARLSQAEVAERLGVTQARISQIEAGLKNPTISVIERFAEVVGCSMAILIKRRRRRKDQGSDI